MSKLELDVEEVFEEAVALGDDLIEGGADDEATAKSIGKFLDNLLPLDALIPGPAGAVAEEVDGPVFTGAAKALIKAFRVDPEVKAARKAKRQAKREARQAKRQAKRDKRWGM